MSELTNQIIYEEIKLDFERDDSQQLQEESVEQLDQGSQIIIYDTTGLKISVDDADRDDRNEYVGEPLNPKNDLAGRRANNVLLYKIVPGNDEVMKPNVPQRASYATYNTISDRIYEQPYAYHTYASYSGQRNRRDSIGRSFL